MIGVLNCVILKKGSAEPTQLRDRFQAPAPVSRIDTNLPEAAELVKFDRVRGSTINAAERSWVLK